MVCTLKASAPSFLNRSAFSAYSLVSRSPKVYTGLCSHSRISPASCKGTKWSTNQKPRSQATPMAWERGCLKPSCSVVRSLLQSEGLLHMYSTRLKKALHEVHELHEIFHDAAISVNLQALPEITSSHLRDLHWHFMHQRGRDNAWNLVRSFYMGTNDLLL